MEPDGCNENATILTSIMFDDYFVRIFMIESLNLVMDVAPCADRQVGAAHSLNFAPSGLESLDTAAHAAAASCMRSQPQPRARVRRMAASQFLIRAFAPIDHSLTPHPATHYHYMKLTRGKPSATLEC